MNQIRTLIAVFIVAAAAGPAYAQVQPEVFDLTHTSLSPSEANALGMMLLNFAQAQAAASSDYATVGPYKKLIRVAVELAPVAEPIGTAHARIRVGLPPETSEKEIPKAELASALATIISKLKTGGARDDEAALRFLCSVGLIVDRTHETFVKESEPHRMRFDTMWERGLMVYERTIMDGLTYTINGVMTTSSGTAEIGEVARLVLTYKATARNHFGLTGVSAQVLRETNSSDNMSRLAAEEAIRYWERFRRQLPLPAGQVEISFEDKFSRKQGPSAGAAYAVVLRSFSDGFPLDSSSALTGDVSVEGRVLTVGGLYAKIRGCVQGGIKRFGFPSVNEGDLVDEIILNGPGFLSELEILGMDTIDDAMAFMRADREEKYKKVSSDFEKLKELVQQGAKAGADPNLPAAIQKLAAGILAVNPKHMSAKYIDLMSKVKLPNRLTLGRSIDESHKVLENYLLTIRQPGSGAWGGGPFQDVQKELTTANINPVVEKIKALNSKMHLDSLKAVEKLEQSAVALQRFLYLRSEEERRAAKIPEAEEVLKDRQEKLRKGSEQKLPPAEMKRLTRAVKDAQEELAAVKDRVTKLKEERKQQFDNGVRYYNEFVIQVRMVVSDPKLLEKLKYGK
ncbi:MAG TPA: S16 family serine protease [Gemmatimonadales bacterium]|nr:S16 family serine protease [Gemmatimonadales bacterium]